MRTNQPSVLFLLFSPPVKVSAGIKVKTIWEPDLGGQLYLILHLIFHYVLAKQQIWAVGLLLTNLSNEYPASLLQKHWFITPWLKLHFSGPVIQMTLRKGCRFILEWSGYWISPYLGPEHRFWSWTVHVILSKRTQPSELVCSSVKWRW